MDWFKGKGRRKDKELPSPLAPVGEKREYLEDSFVSQRVLDADFDRLVQLPSHLDNDEWLATHTISFFHHVNLMYGAVSEYCTSTTCPSMAGPDSVEYQWQDERGRKVKQSAPLYIDHIMSLVQKSVMDETLFPTKFGVDFPAGFSNTVSRIHRYLFQVLAHLYHAHSGQVIRLGLVGHLNTLFTHFMVFSTCFSLLPDKDVLVLGDLLKALLHALKDQQTLQDCDHRDLQSQQDCGERVQPSLLDSGKCYFQFQQDHGKNVRQSLQDWDQTKRQSSMGHRDPSGMAQTGCLSSGHTGCGAEVEDSKGWNTAGSQKGVTATETDMYVV